MRIENVKGIMGRNECERRGNFTEKLVLVTDVNVMRMKKKSRETNRKKR